MSKMRLRRTRTWRRAGARVVLCLLVATVVTGCTTARSDLASSDSSCYHALPTANKAIHRKGHLLEVQQLTVGMLQRQAPDLYGELQTHAPASKRICVVAFSGTFDASSVSLPKGRHAGRLAVVISTSPDNHLLGTVLFARPPLRFGRAHAG
jgi:hypothetical protein